MSDDRRWSQRVHLSYCLLMDGVDAWCRDDRDFPFDAVVASVFYLFSPQCDPFAISESKLYQTLLGVVGSSAEEYAKTWPNHDVERQSDVIESLLGILQDAVRQWEEGSLATPSISSVNQQIVDWLVECKFVTFHHNATTRRDSGGFYSHG